MSREIKARKRQGKKGSKVNKRKSKEHRVCHVAVVAKMFAERVDIVIYYSEKPNTVDKG